MNEVAERAPSTERRVERKVLGKYETADVPVTQLVRLPQVRKGNNSELAKLKDSIRANGLLNSIDVARLSEAELEAYIAFVNRTWRTKVSIGDYQHLRQQDEEGEGYYNLVIAGHSRTEAVSQLQQEDPYSEYCLRVKIHDVKGYADIIRIQLDENIYSPPQPARRAMAVIESYHHWLETHEGQGEEEFLAQSEGKFSSDVLKDAIGFSKLPLQAQDYVFTGKVSYSAAVALGDASDTLMQFAGEKLEAYREAGGSAITLYDMYSAEVMLLIAHIFNERMGAARAKKYVESQVAHKEELMEQMARLKEQPALFLISPEDQAQAYHRQLISALRSARATMNHLSVDSVREVQRIMGQIVGDEAVPKDLEDERQARIRALGYSAAQQLVELAG